MGSYVLWVAQLGMLLVPQKPGWLAALQKIQIRWGAFPQLDQPSLEDGLQTCQCQHSQAHWKISTQPILPFIFVLNFQSFAGAHNTGYPIKRYA